MKLLKLQRTMARAVMQPLTPSERMQRKAPDGKSMREYAGRFIKPNDRLTSFERLEIYNRQYWLRLFSSMIEDFPGLRSVLGGAELDTLLGERDRLNEDLQHVIDTHTEPWGIKVSAVEIKDVEIPDRMQHAIARQAEAERERRAKIIDAEGEFQSAEKLSQAADLISRNPVTIQLRYLQTLREIGATQNSTIVFPIPIDLMKPALDALARASGPPAQASSDEAGVVANGALAPAPERVLKIGASERATPSRRVAARAVAPRGPSKASPKA